MFLLVALRAWFVGVDTQTYIKWFINDGTDLHQTEPLWNLYLGLMIALTKNVQVFLATTAALILVPLFILIKKKSEYSLFSLFVYYILPNDQGFIFVMSGMRQAFAITIILWMFYAAEKKNWKWVVILSVAAFLMHNSSIIAFLGILAASKFKPSRNAFGLIAVLSVVVLIFSYSTKDVFSLIKNTDLMQLAFIEDYSSYADYMVGEYSMSFMDTVFLVLPVLIMFILLFLNPEILKTLFARMYIIGGFLLVAFHEVPMISRYFMYLILMEIFLLPKLYYSKEFKQNKILCLFLITVHVMVFLLYLYFNNARGVDYDMRRVAPYHFFFEQGFPIYY